MALRTAVALGCRLPLGAFGDPAVLRANSLEGWLHPGAGAAIWSRPAFLAGIVWEWLPALLFGLGLWRWLERPGADLPWLRIPARWRGWAGFAALLSIAAGIAILCFGGIPHVQDSISQQFQAEVFARGRFFAPTPPQVEFVSGEFLVQDGGRWFAQYPPGQALLLALGVLAGVPTLVNPLLGALTGVLLYLAARRAYGPQTAGIALALVCVSPFVWFMSGERMNHVGNLFWIALALFALAPAYARRPSPVPPVRLALAGLALGLAISTRPLCGVAAAVPLLAGLYLSPLAGKQGDGSEGQGQGSAGPLSPAPGTLLLLFGLLLGLVPLLLFNSATTGSAFESGYEAQWGSSGWGFGESQWGPPHTLARGIEHTWTNWDAAGRYLFEWPIPCLFLLPGVLALRRRTRMDGVLAGLLLSVTAAYLPYFFQDLCLGPRFLYAALPAFILLSARGLRGWGLLWAHRRRLAPRRGLSRLGQAVALCAVAGLAANVPVLVYWYGNGFWGTETALVDQVRERKLGGAIVFIRDYNLARFVELQKRGVSRRTTQGAVTELDERWIDRQIASLDMRDELTAEERGALLEERLRNAIDDPVRLHRRLHVPWQDYRGFSSTAYSGFFANTPWPARQPVLYALDLGLRNKKLLRAYPGRTAWLYGWDREQKKYVLQPLPPDPVPLRTARRKPAHSGG